MNKLEANSSLKRQATNEDSYDNSYGQFSKVDSKKSFYSIESQLPNFPHGQIAFDDGLQRLRKVYTLSKWSNN